ncbi:MAG: hypothetical protein CMJ89_00775 [Planctomycetes bacterium]|nr:hypothetical protein [Planctomycetota bacterium]
MLAACDGGGGGGGDLPLLTDSDGDGLPDSLESHLSSDPTDADDPFVGGALDLNTVIGPGVDNIPDGLEQYLFDTGSSAPITAQTDTDFDGIPDYAEVRSGLDHLDFDDPHLKGNQDLQPSGPPLDGINDGLEIYLVRRGATAPITKENDTDRDGFGDVLEMRTGTNPFDVQDPFYVARFDLDADGLSDAFEVEFGIDPLDSDEPVTNGGRDERDATGPPTDGITDAMETILDFLGATLPVTARVDTDGDGVFDYLEARSGSSPTNSDEPVPAGNLDSDGDGVLDGLEALLTRSGAVGVDGESDQDGDRIPDVLEAATGSDPFDPRDPSILLQADVDLDGIPDALELRLGLDAEDSDSPVVNGEQDTNDMSGPPNDSVSDAMEEVLLMLGATGSVTMLSDTDEDGVTDVIEALFLSDLTDSDSPEVNGGDDINSPAGPQGDGVSDALESVLLALGAEGPVTPGSDSDGDSIPDVIEVRTLTDPFDPSDPAPGGSRDADGDGAFDYLELLVDADPLDPNDPSPSGADDSDGDGLSDAFEEALARLGIPDVQPDTDSDGDGLFDALEVVLPSRVLDRDDPVLGGGDTNDETGPSGDGVSDALEHYLVASGVAAPVTGRTDSDVDGIPDIYEARFATGFFDREDPLAGGSGNLDGDADGILDGVEFVLERLGAVSPGPGTDLDFDRAPDYLEIRIGGNPLDPTNPSPDGALDTDGDDIPESIPVLLLRLGVFAIIDGRVDSDSDGAPDVFEVTAPFHPSFVPFVAPDPRFGDLPVPNGGMDLDDGDQGGGPVDAISDAFERLLVSLGARAPIDHGTDTDGDGAPDYLEVFAVSDLLDASHPVENGGLDSDGDLLSDGLEAVLLRLGAEEPLGTASDTDADGIPDYFEIAGLGQPVDGDLPVVAGGLDENDDTGPPNDGISDGLEFVLIELGTSGPVFASSETDGDGLPDYLEVRAGFDPYDSDSPLPNGDQDTNDETGPAGDGITDALENYLLNLGAVGPITMMTDSDNDGVPDMLEIFRGTDPLDPESTVEDGVPPQALEVRITGPPFIGGTLMGSYRYFDPENDIQGETVERWLRNGIEVPGEVNEHFVIPADLNSVLTYEVTPISLFAFPSDTAVGDTISVTIAPGDFDGLTGEDGPGGYSIHSGGNLVEFWVRADRGVVVDPSSDLVLQWKDNALIPNNARPLADGLEPRLVERAGPPALPAVRFFGGQALRFPSPLSGKFTLAAVTRTTNFVQGNSNWKASPAIVGTSRASSTPANLRLGVEFGISQGAVNNRRAAGDAPVADGEPHLLMLTRDEPRHTLYLDGEFENDQTHNASSINDSDWLLGSAFDTGGQYDGDIYEVFAVAEVSGEARRKLLEHHFAGRYGIDLQSEVLYARLSTHGKDVTGIGRISDSDRVSGASGTGAVGIFSPTALSDGDFFLWGHNGSGKLEADFFGIGGYTFRLRESWSVTLTDGGNGDGVGLVNVELRLGDLNTLNDVTRWGIILIDLENPTPLILPADSIDPMDNTLRFSGVDFGGVDFFSFAVR